MCTLVAPTFFLSAISESELALAVAVGLPLGRFTAGRPSNLTPPPYACIELSGYIEDSFEALMQLSTKL